jgi:hypothetical protein
MAGGSLLGDNDLFIQKCIKSDDFSILCIVQWYIETKNKGGINMVLGGPVVDGCGCGPRFLPGIAIVVVIILLLIAMGICF